MREVPSHFAKNVIFDAKKPARLGGPERLSAYECYKTRVPVWRSAIKPARAENEVFASQNFGKKARSGSYYGLLAYGDFGRELRCRTQYGKKYMEGTSQSFCMWAVKLEERVSDRKNQRNSVRVVTYLFSATRHISQGCNVGEKLICMYRVHAQEKNWVCGSWGFHLCHCE